MRNHQILIDEIRGTFASDELISPDLYRSLAEDYAKACKDMIGRLKACVAYLRSGNTAEAVRLAELEPNLFEMYNLLDFPEREEWLNMLESFGGKMPPPFPKELAIQLNDAYYQSAMLEPLQKRYRVLAIERAPLAERLQVLRSIVAGDPINPSWRKDLETFEEERIKELGHDIDRAVADNNDVEMRKLHKELSQNWCVPVPSYMRDKLNVKLRGIHFQSLNKRLEDLVGQLQQAYSERSINQVQLLADEIREIVCESGMAMPVELSDRADGAVRWLNDEKKRRKLIARYEATLRQLKSELYDEASTDELVSTHDALSAAARDVSQTIPALIDEEYHDVIRSRERQANHRRLVNILLITLGIAMLIATTMIVGVWWLEKQRIDGMITELQQMLDSDVWPPDEVLKYINDHDNDIRKSPEADRLCTELQRKIDADRTRKNIDPPE